MYSDFIDQLPCLLILIEEENPEFQQLDTATVTFTKIKNLQDFKKSFGKLFYSKLLISIHWSLKKKTENVVTQNFWSAKISHSKLSLEAK